MDMSFFRKILCFLFALTLLVSLVPAAFAEGGDERFEGKTWDEIIQDFFDAHQTETGRITLGYYNTVTGEEHYYQGDKYMTAASLYKVPLNMYYTDKIYHGEMDWDTTFSGIPYSDIQLWTIRDSNNEISEMMQRYVGNYVQYREAILPYIGETAASVDSEYYRLNTFTAKQMVSCLKMVWEDQERFAGIIDAMLLAVPDNYFKYTPIEYEVAHKYGYLDYENHLYMNDMGYVFTDQPIILVFMADTISYHLQAMTDYCALMADYAQYTASLLPEPTEEPTEAPAEEPTIESAPVAEPEIAPQPEIPELPEAEAADVSDKLLLTVIAGVTLLLCVGAILARKKMRLVWSLPAALFTGATLAVCVIAPKAGTVICRPTGDPAAVAESFFSAIVSGDYDSAYARLGDYADLGLENVPENETDALLYDRLRQSYAYELVGECVTDGLTAKQQVSFHSFRIADIGPEVEEKTAENIEQFVSTHLRQDIYDENDNYLPSVVTDAYAAAVRSVLDHAEDYTAANTFTVTLEFSGGEWRVITNPELLKALLGGIA